MYILKYWLEINKAHFFVVLFQFLQHFPPFPLFWEAPFCSAKWTKTTLPSNFHKFWGMVCFNEKFIFLLFLELIRTFLLNGFEVAKKRALQGRKTYQIAWTLSWNGIFHNFHFNFHHFWNRVKVRTPSFSFVWLIVCLYRKMSSLKKSLKHKELKKESVEKENKQTLFEFCSPHAHSLLCSILLSLWYSSSKCDGYRKRIGRW
jgi:hypothetical protein